MKKSKGFFTASQLTPLDPDFDDFVFLQGFFEHERKSSGMSDADHLNRIMGYKK